MNKENNDKRTVNKYRDNYLDALKGLAIVLVVLGHAIQTHQATFDNNPLFRLIYSFHMPLFMFLSGAVASYSRKPMNLKFIKNKFYTLVIPFMSWAVIAYFLPSRRSITFLGYIKSILKSPDIGLWFLWILFLMFCVLALALRMRKYVGRASYILVTFLVYAVPASRFGFGLLRWHLPFFITGLLIFKYQKRLLPYKKMVLYMSLAIFPLVVFKWHRATEPFFAVQLKSILDAHKLSYISVGDVLSLDTFGITRMVYYYLVAFSGIGSVYLLFNTFFARKTHKLFRFLGYYTLDIYAMSNYFLFIGVGVGLFWVGIFMASVYAVTMPILISTLIIRRLDILNRLLLGGRTIPKATVVK